MRDYVQTQIVYSLLQEDESRPLHVIANYLLFAGRYDEAVFRQMIDAGCFARLVELLKNRREDDRRLHRLLLELMYEMARIERVRIADLLHVDDGFVSYLFQIIEDLSDDIDDPYHYPVIRVLLVLNEQYMVAATTAAVDAIGLAPDAPLTNRVVKILSRHGLHFRTFGENIILLLNRATETALQLLILKLLYLLFTTHATYEYFYTNDLRVLVDVIIRNLLDLPDESASLRHTYLRVFYPLLAHTQLNQPPQYKRDEILRVLAILSGSGNAHFAPADETTLRLVSRVSNVAWLAESVTPPESPSPDSLEADTADADAPYNIEKASFATATTRTSIASSAGSYLTASSSNATTDDEQQQQQRQHNTVVNKFLGISLGSGDDNSGRESRTSVASVADVAAVKEKPGVKTPSRKVVAESSASALQPTDTGILAEADATLASTAEAATAADSVAAYLGDTDQHQSIPPLQLEQSTPTPTSTATSTPPRLPSHPPGQKARAKRVLPAVPRHRHGVPVKAQPPPPPQQRQGTPPPRPPTASSQSQSPSQAQPQPSPQFHPQPQTAEAAAGVALSGAGVSPRMVPNGGGYNVAASEAHPTAAAAAAAATAAHAHSHAHNTGVKKLPPKLPPPRRVGRLKAAASNMNLHQSAIDPSAN